MNFHQRKRTPRQQKQQTKQTNEKKKGILVPSTQSRVCSTIALAAEAAEDSFRAAITAAPRFCTVVINAPRIHSSSLIAAASGC